MRAAGTTWRAWPARKAGKLDPVAHDSWQQVPSSAALLRPGTRHHVSSAMRLRSRLIACCPNVNAHAV
jgi:hypothetical protein